MHRARFLIRSLLSLVFLAPVASPQATRAQMISEGLDYLQANRLDFTPMIAWSYEDSMYPFGGPEEQIISVAVTSLVGEALVRAPGWNASRAADVEGATNYLLQIPIETLPSFDQSRRGLALVRESLLWYPSVHGANATP